MCSKVYSLLGKVQTVKLTCHVIYAFKILVFQILATGTLMITADPRVSVVSEGGRSLLSLARVEPGDTGEYVCQVNL